MMRRISVCFLILIVVCSASYTKAFDQAVVKKSSKTLELDALINKVETVRGEDGFVTVKLTISLNFKNIGGEPLILAIPSYDYTWNGDILLAPNKELAAMRRGLYSRRIFLTPPNFEKLTQRLDQPTPPSDSTVIVKPAEHWNYQTLISIKVSEKRREGSSDMPFEQALRLYDSLWIRLYYEIWSYKIDNVKTSLSSRLKERWRPYGQFWTTNDDEVGHGTVASQPIEIPISEFN